MRISRALSLQCAPFLLLLALGSSGCESSEIPPVEPAFRGVRTHHFMLFDSSLENHATFQVEGRRTVVEDGMGIVVGTVRVLAEAVEVLDRQANTIFQITLPEGFESREGQLLSAEGAGLGRISVGDSHEIHMYGPEGYQWGVSNISTSLNGIEVVEVYGAPGTDLMARISSEEGDYLMNEASGLLIQKMSGASVYPLWMMGVMAFERIPSLDSEYDSLFRAGLLTFLSKTEL